MDSKPHKPGSITLVSAVIAVIAHGLWWLVPQPVTEAAAVHAPKQLIVYPDQGPQVWSPTLFSLPSTLGFSGVMQRGPEERDPPLQSPLRLEVHRPLQPGSLFPRPDLPPPPRIERHGAEFSPPVPAPREPASRFVWTLRVSTPGAPSEEIELTRLPPAVDPPTVLVMKGELLFDSGGQVRSVLVDSGGPEEPWRGRMTRALRRTRLPRGTGDRRLRFRLSYEPEEV